MTSLIHDTAGEYDADVDESGSSVGFSGLTQNRGFVSTSSTAHGDSAGARQAANSVSHLYNNIDAGNVDSSAPTPQRYSNELFRMPDGSYQISCLSTMLRRRGVSGFPPPPLRIDYRSATRSSTSRPANNQDGEAGEALSEAASDRTSTTGALTPTTEDEMDSQLDQVKFETASEAMKVAEADLIACEAAYAQVQAEAKKDIDIHCVVTQATEAKMVETRAAVEAPLEELSATKAAIVRMAKEVRESQEAEDDEFDLFGEEDPLGLRRMEAAEGGGCIQRACVMAPAQTTYGKAPIQPSPQHSNLTTASAGLTYAIQEVADYGLNLLTAPDWVDSEREMTIYKTQIFSAPDWVEGKREKAEDGDGWVYQARGKAPIQVSPPYNNLTTASAGLDDQIHSSYNEEKSTWYE